ncbi:hypothetical protein QUF82_22410 [Thiotrichales bacterium HSG14]|nr:hypothetical protein [Thiotrichales bacterium HSG14]
MTLNRLGNTFFLVPNLPTLFFRQPPSFNFLVLNFQIEKCSQQSIKQLTTSIKTMQFSLPIVIIISVFFLLAVGAILFPKQHGMVISALLH